MASRKIIAVTAVLAVTLFLFSVLGNKAFAAVTKKMTIRGTDGYGSGSFLASRDGGSRQHHGIDVVTAVNEPVYSPISGTVTRLAYPYADDTSYKGLVIENSGILVKLFYVSPTVTPGTTVKAGQQIGTAQNLNRRYPGITNHIHVEVYVNGQLTDPTKLF